jgi:hypothetical protein
MYERYEDGGEVTKISLSFCEAQALRRVIAAHSWSAGDFSFENEHLHISNYKSLKDPLLVLTAHCKVDQDTLRQDGAYVLADALDSVMKKIQDIWEMEFES